MIGSAPRIPGRWGPMRACPSQGSPESYLNLCAGRALARAGWNGFSDESESTGSLGPAADLGRAGLPRPVSDPGRPYRQINPPGRVGGPIRPWPTMPRVDLAGMVNPMRAPPNRTPHPPAPTARPSAGKRRPFATGAILALATVVLILPGTLASAGAARAPRRQRWRTSRTPARAKVGDGAPSPTSPPPSSTWGRTTIR